MLLETIAIIATLALGAASGAWGWSFWWAVGAAFLAASFHITNGPTYDRVMTANREGRFHVMPLMIGVGMVPLLLVSGCARWAFG